VVLDNTVALRGNFMRGNVYKTPHVALAKTTFVEMAKTLRVAIAKTPRVAMSLCGNLTRGNSLYRGVAMASRMRLFCFSHAKNCVVPRKKCHTCVKLLMSSTVVATRNMMIEKGKLVTSVKKKIKK